MWFTPLNETKKAWTPGSGCGHLGIFWSLENSCGTFRMVMDMVGHRDQRNGIKVSTPPSPPSAGRSTPLPTRGTQLGGGGSVPLNWN